MKRALLYIFFILIVVAIWSASHFAIFGKKSFEPESANVLIAGLAFAGVIIGLFQQQSEIQMQREDLALQRDEMILTRDEMKEAREEMKLQNDTIRLQRFENTFFNMLNLHHDIVNHIDIEQTVTVFIKDRANTPSKSYTARDAFEYTYNLFQKKIAKWKVDNHGREITEEELNHLFIEHYNNYKTDFGHYFRNLYRIIKTISETVFDDDLIKNFNEQYRYTSIIRAQLSDFELLWLYYNCLSDNGIDFFKPLVEKYTLLKNMPFSEIANPNSKSWYLRTARRRPADIKIHLELMSSTNPFEFYEAHKLELFDVESLDD